MTARTRRSKTHSAKSGQGRLGDEGAERYMWVFPEGHHIVLTIPGLRDLELTVNDARTIGEILIQTAGQVDHLGHPGYRHDGARCRGDGYGDICPSEHCHC